MYLIKSSDNQYYTGKTGWEYLGKATEAFEYNTLQAAEYRCQTLNLGTRLHGLTFEVVS